MKTQSPVMCDFYSNSKFQCCITFFLSGHRWGIKFILWAAKFKLVCLSHQGSVVLTTWVCREVWILARSWLHIKTFTAVGSSFDPRTSAWESKFCSRTWRKVRSSGFWTIMLNDRLNVSFKNIVEGVVGRKKNRRHQKESYSQCCGTRNISYSPPSLLDSQH